MKKQKVSDYFPKPTVNNPKDVLRIPVATIVSLGLKKASHRCRTVEDLVNLLYSFRLSRLIIRPFQVKEEILILLKLLVRVQPRAILEIGTATGGTFFLFSRVASSNATVISVDLPGPPFGGGYSEWRIPLYKSFSWGRQKITLIKADSHNPRTLEAIKEILSDRRLDFLFIDGDHSYEGVKRDFEMYAKLVRLGGMVAFHDIVPGSTYLVGGVPEFWSEVKQNFNFVEIVKNWGQGAYGIGVLNV